MIEHTPGPWEKVCRVDHTGEPELFVQTEGDLQKRLAKKRIVTWDIPYPDNADCANAGLIAAAPELLKACQVAADLYDHLALGTLEAAAKYGPDYEPPTQSDCLEVRNLLADAIAKATNNAKKHAPSGAAPESPPVKLRGKE